jgi:hypothetical protein
MDETITLTKNPVPAMHLADLHLHTCGIWENDPFVKVPLKMQTEELGWIALRPPRRGTRCPDIEMGLVQQSANRVTQASASFGPLQQRRLAYIAETAGRITSPKVSIGPISCTLGMLKMAWSIPISASDPQISTTCAGDISLSARYTVPRVVFSISS